MNRLRTSLRLKLTLATLLPLLAAVALCWIFGVTVITTRMVSQAQQTVAADLGAAREILLGDVTHLTDTLRLASQTPELLALLQAPKPQPTAAGLQALLHTDQLSFITLVDRYGIVHYRAANPGSRGDTLRRDPLIADALRGLSTAGLAVYPPQQAGRENPALPAQMRIAIQPTPHARLYHKKSEERGLFLIAAVPVKDGQGQLLGVVYGGVLLNNDQARIEHITRILFQRGAGQASEAGSATLFLDDVRIATSVRDSRGQPVIGSLMSEAVQAVVSRGEAWVDRAFVYNAWYLSAYAPLRDYRGQVIGALYVGLPEAPLVALRTRIHLIFAAVMGGVAILGALLATWLGKSLARPIKALEEGVRRVAAGERLPDLPIATQDEIGRLAEEFNRMQQQLTIRAEENLLLNRTLEDKVQARTAELAEKNRQLLAAQQELARAERLASLGRLASGVAHEINNPLAIIRGNAELLQLAGAESEETTTIIRQVGRIERIVANLRSFSRSTALQRGAVPLTPLLDAILDQLDHQIPLAGYRLERAYRTTPLAALGDEDQLRQVFTNLIINGLQAMPDGGVLQLDAQPDHAQQQVLISIRDHGPGIAADCREKLFTPFFTTKRGGTGLGLAISYGIVRDHGGEIRVASQPGQGATFTVVLPLAD